ncbi:MAG: MFS transporter [Desulfobacterales bacterium]|jgi:MFS family permease|nr:MFS transporter [Desulfobacterales bacterium]
MEGARIDRLRVFFPFALGYFLSLLFRVVNSVIAPDLVSGLGLGPSELGLLTATYFVTFAAFQLPLGVLLDRFGPRMVQACLLLFAAAGALVFSQAQGIAGLAVGRALVGLGVSSCLMAAFKAFTLWFPRGQWPRVNGFQLAAGGLGAMAATAPVQAALSLTDWRGIFVLLAALAGFAAAAVFWVVPEKKTAAAASCARDQFKGVARVFTSRVFWRVTPLVTASQATFMSIQSLWAGPWLRDSAGLDRSAVAAVLMWLAAAMAVGYILLGALAERLNRRGIKPETTSVAGMSAFIVVQALIVVHPGQWSLPLWLLFGAVGTTGVIAYAGLSQSFPVELAGRVNTALNLVVFVAAFAAQWGIGAVIALWPVSPSGAFAIRGYQAAFGLMIALQLAALAWYAAAGRPRRTGASA